MLWRKQILPILALALAFASSACVRAPLPPSAIATTNTSSPTGALEELTLDNGLTVLLNESHALPIVTFDYWARVGSADEPTTLAGLSHFLKRAVFRGAGPYGPGELDREIEVVGGQWNAAASRDAVHYQVTLDSRFAETGVRALAAVVANATLAPEQVDRERYTAIEEHDRAQGDPGAILNERLHDAAFDAGPYKTPVLGTPATLSRVTTEVLRDFYDRFYAPGNCALVIVGDVTKEEIRPLLEETFGRDRRTIPPLRRRPPALLRASQRTRSFAEDIGETYLAIGFPAPSVRRKREFYAMDLLAIALGDGRSSRLHLRLRQQDRLVSDIATEFSPQRYPSLLTIGVVLDRGNLGATREAIRDELHQARRRIGSDDLRRAKRIACANLAYASQTTAGLAEFIGWRHTVSGDERFLDTYVEEIDRVTTGDMERVAREFLTDERAVEVYLTPNAPAPGAGSP